ncbi:uncharacterized protein BDZ83DRAFT_758966 [Colletotrichum acutatum]|uniref:Uncharacterized protein n=1 Tax=Glomerella acutata TaxID=27357 RepID=A0AAD8U8Y7_GLOAC|nr:uncharacterized protein BDZ83DRAFT_758966 [Colletotrichum acutatum]KAK1702940.1 hypothetical protein BDZ83DRAFT_758966 [Colletotrichum acutatum]
MAPLEEQSVGQVCHTPWLETFLDGLSYGESPPQSMPLLLSEFIDNEYRFQDMDSFKKNWMDLEDSWRLPLNIEKDWESHPEYPMGLWVGWFIPAIIRPGFCYKNRGSLCVNSFTAPPINNATVRKAFKVVYRLDSGIDRELYALYSPDEDGLCKAKLVPGGAQNVFFFKEWRDDAVCGRYNRVATWMGKADAGAMEANLARKVAIGPSPWHSRMSNVSGKHDGVKSSKEKRILVNEPSSPPQRSQGSAEEYGSNVLSSDSSSDLYIPEESSRDDDSADSEPPSTTRRYKMKTGDYSTPVTRSSRRRSSESESKYSHSHSKKSPALTRTRLWSRGTRRGSAGSPQSRGASRGSPQASSLRASDDGIASPSNRQSNDLDSLRKSSVPTHNLSPQKRKKTRTSDTERSQTEPPRKQHRTRQARKTHSDQSDNLQSDIKFLVKDEKIGESDIEVQFVKEIPIKRDGKKPRDTGVANRTQPPSDNDSILFVSGFVAAGKLALVAGIPDAFPRNIMLETFRGHLTSTEMSHFDALAQNLVDSAGEDIRMMLAETLEEKLRSRLPAVSD